MDKKIILYWFPRVLAIFYIMFLAIFALDVFIPGQTLSYYLGALFMHLIPNFVLAAFLYWGWKNEKVGAALFLLAFLVMFAMFWDRSFIWLQFLLFSPLLLVSFLFWFHTRYGGR
jgi:hypothetical protein